MIEQCNFKKKAKKTKTCYFGEVWKLGEGINFQLMPGCVNVVRVKFECSMRPNFAANVLQ